MLSYFKLQGTRKMISLSTYSYLINLGIDFSPLLNRKTDMFWFIWVLAFPLPCRILVWKIPLLALYSVRLRHSGLRIVQCTWRSPWSPGKGAGIVQNAYKLFQVVYSLEDETEMNNSDPGYCAVCQVLCCKAKVWAMETGRMGFKASLHPQFHHLQNGTITRCTGLPCP